METAEEQQPANILDSGLKDKQEPEKPPEKLRRIGTMRQAIKQQNISKMIGSLKVNFKTRIQDQLNLQKLMQKKQEKPIEEPAQDAKDKDDK